MDGIGEPKWARRRDERPGLVAEAHAGRGPRRRLGAAVAALAAVVCAMGVAAPLAAQELPPARAADVRGEPGTMTLTIFLKHDEAQTLDEINERLRRQRFYESFPPPGVEVLSWNVLMGVGQVVTLRFPAERLREVNRAVEKTAWGGYRTEFYPTYDYRPTAAKERDGLPSAFK